MYPHLAGTQINPERSSDSKLVLISLLVLFVALFAVLRGRRLIVFLTCGVVFWLLGSWLSGPILHLSQIGYEDIVTPRFAPRMVFVMLGGGTQYDSERRLVPKVDVVPRIETTAALYKQCLMTEQSCRVIVSGGNPQRHELAEADAYAPYLLDAGVKSSDLILENKSLDTFENARNVARLLQPMKYDTLVLVTSSYHMRRGLLAFDVFGLSPQPVVSNVRNPKSWWVPHPEGWIDSNSALHELVGLVRFYVWRGLGLYSARPV